MDDRIEAIPPEILRAFERLLPWWTDDDMAFFVGFLTHLGCLLLMVAGCALYVLWRWHPEVFTRAWWQAWRRRAR